MARDRNNNEREYTIELNEDEISSYSSGDPNTVITSYSIGIDPIGISHSIDSIPVEPEAVIISGDEAVLEENEPEDRYTRFKDAEWFGKNPNILIGGAGGIGSWLALFLARTGNKNLFIYDTDRFSLVNLAGQFTNNSQIGKYKVNAVKDLVYLFAGVNIYTMNVEYTASNGMGCEIVCAAFDNMKARRDMFDVWKMLLRQDPHPDKYLLIDGRLMAEGFHIYCVTKNNMDWYEREKLLDDNMIPDAPCTLKQTTHVAASIAGCMTGFITNHISNMSFGQYVRELPSSFKMDIPSCTVQIDNETHKK